MLKLRYAWRSIVAGRLLLLFLLMTLVPAGALVVLGLRLASQDRVLLGQRIAELRQADLNRAAQALAAQVQSWHQTLAAGDFRGAADLPSDSALIFVSTGEIRALPPGRMLWSPLPPRLAQAPEGAFREAERLEFAGGREQEALRGYESLARSPEVAVRASALLRLARLHRRAARWNEALAVYERMAACTGASINGMPADLLARRARCEILRKNERRAEFDREVSVLRREWLAGRWLLDRPSFLLVTGQLSAWDRATQFQPAAGETMAAAAEWLSKRLSHPDHALAGSSFLTLNETTITLVWQTTRSGLLALAAGPELVERNWRRKAAAGLPPYRKLVMGGESAGAALQRSAAETGLPWATGLIETGSVPVPAEWSARQRVLWWALSAVVVLLAACGFLLWRTFRREMEVARLQAGFVSAVSHEFRTPLTTILHLGGLLMENDDLGHGRRRDFYRMQNEAAERLRRSVESLLDFSRMEGGARTYRMEAQDASALAREAVDAFSAESAASGFRIRCEPPPGLMPVVGDREALFHVLWNLLDNAVKYSGESRDVEVSVTARDSRVEVSVTDHGIGIPACEQERVFDKFTRGEEAVRQGIRGTGIGLAMARHIVESHQGKIELESVPGEGSRFTVRLPWAG